MRNLRLDLCYDGTRYRGWQRIPGADNTIQGKLEQTLSRILDEPVEVSGSGRTDAGVHALGQVASFHCESSMPADQILEQLRRYLPEDIGIYSCKEAAPRFHARLNARGKTYCYRIWNSEAPCVFQRRYVACFPERLDVEAMNRAGQQMLGEHDFAAFCARAKVKKSTVRCITALRVACIGNEIQITVTADGFLYNMVRAITGTVLYAAEGKLTAEDIPKILDSGDRTLAGPTVPPGGLYMTRLWYEDERLND